MPTFKSYVNKDGYYINARPSNVGNVTYQVETDAAAFIRELGYDHEDELPWGIVKPLRVAGLIYTNRQGVTNDDQNVPGLDPSKLPKLSKHDRDQLIAYLENRTDIPEYILHRLRGRINDTQDDAQILAAAVEQEIDTSAEVTINHEDDPVGFGSLTIHIEYAFSRLSLPGRTIKHRIDAANSPEVDEWSVEHPFDDTWEGAAKATEQKIRIMKALSQVADQVSFEIRPSQNKVIF